MAVYDPIKTRFDSRFPVDRILSVYTGVETAIAVGGRQISFLIPELNNDTPIFVGIWSLDQSTWYTLGASKLTAIGTTSFGTLIYCTSGTRFVITASNVAEPTTNFYYKIVAIDKPVNQAPPLQIIGLDRKDVLNSQYNYQKIATQGWQNDIIMAPSTTYTLTVPYTNSTVPCCRGFIQFNDFGGLTDQMFDMRFNGISTNVGANASNISTTITADTSNIYYKITNTISSGIGLTVNSKIYYRVYYDA